MSERVSTVVDQNESASGSGMRDAVTMTCDSSWSSLSAGVARPTQTRTAAYDSARRTVRPVVMGKLLKLHTPVPEGSWLSEAGRRAVSEAYRRTSIARRDAHRLTLRPVSGLSSGSLRLRRIAFPHPSLRCSGSCDPLDLDYRCGGSAGFGRIRTGLPV